MKFPQLTRDHPDATKNVSDAHEASPGHGAVEVCDIDFDAPDETAVAPDPVRFVDLGRRLLRWAHAADKAASIGRDPGLGALRRFCALKREFYAAHGVNLTHPHVGAVANAFLRRGDLLGLRRAMAEIVRREIATAALKATGPQPRHLGRGHDRRRQMQGRTSR